MRKGSPLTSPDFLDNIGIMNPNIFYIKRDLEPLILNSFNKGKVIILYGARQVGKTSLLKQLFGQKKDTLYLSCEQTRIKQQLVPDSLILGRLLGNFKTIILDEAQHLDEPGLILKVMIDNFTNLNILASGSSSFDLAGKITEPLTGRYFRYQLFPISSAEIKKYFLPQDFRFEIEQTLLFGSYPEIFKLKGNEEKINYLNLLADAYLYKDILSFNLVRDSRKVRELLTALALQIGQEVSYNELASTLAIDRKTVEKYLDLLEKSFVIFRLYGFSRNLRSEINRKVKIYFYDLGIRNVLINNFNPLHLRNDAGGIFENFVIVQKLIKEANRPQKASFYFWRTYGQDEIDLICQKNEKLSAFEIKLKPKKSKSFSVFQSLYKKSALKIITWKNFSEEI